jgi:hypothetical protein
MMIGRLLKHIVLAFFVMVAINQISPLVLNNTSTQNRCKGRNFLIEDFSSEEKTKTLPAG